MIKANEYISRIAMDRLLIRFCKEATDNNVALYEHFLDIPTADVKPVIHGRWIKSEHDGMRMIVFECSNCGSYYPLPDGLNFCPHCGADMRGGEEC